jgi:NitT/TauT family transport system substrate-binding protein
MHRLTALLAALLVVVAVGCGGDDEPSGGGSAETTAEGPPKQVKIALLPVADVAPVYLGMKKGFFREENIDLKPQFAQGGAAIVPSVLSNDVQFGFGNNVSLMVARGRGLPLRIVSEGVQGAGKPEDAANALLVSKDSRLRRVEDMKGATVLVTTLQQLGDVTVKRTLEKHGVDPNSVKFLETPFPEMNAAIERRRADVAWQAEPFITIGKQQGMRSIADPMYETTPNLSIASYFGADPYLEENPEVAQGFARAMRKSLEYARDHPEEARAVIPTYAKVPRAVLEKMQLANWSPDLNVDSIRLTHDLARKYGVLDKDVDLQELLPRESG